MTQVRKLPEFKKPFPQSLPEGRFRMTRYFVAETGQTMPTSYFPDYGEPDTDAPAGFDNLRLITRDFAYERDGTPGISAVYETLTDTLQKESADEVDFELNGLCRVTRRLIGLPTATDGNNLVTTTLTGPGDIELFLGQKKDVKSDGALRVVLVFLQPGLLETHTTISNNGALQVITITAFNQVPATPDGFVLVETDDQTVSGLPTRIYRFAQGNGRISTDTGFLFRGKLKKTTIKYLGTDSESTPSGDVVGTSEDQADGYVVHTRVYAEPVGDGYILNDKEIRNNGRLVIYHVARIGSVPADPSPTIGGTVNLINTVTKQEEGFTIYDYHWAEGYGEVRRETADGPVAGTQRITVETFANDPSDAVAGDGLLVESLDIQADGFIRCTRVTVAGTVAGVKQTYTDIVDVHVPGTVNLTTLAVTAGDLSGTVAVADVTPPRIKRADATVTVEITATPPTTGTAAFDLGSISCSVASTQVGYHYRGFDQGQTRDGSLTMTHPRKAAGVSGSIQHYPGCYLSGATSATGTFSYTAGAQYSLSSGGTVLTETEFTSTEVTKLVGTGSTSAAGYATSGILQRRSRPVFSTLAGVTYYEVITWTI